MKYVVTLNGKRYEVEVSESDAVLTSVSNAAPAAPVPAAAPVAAPAAAPASPAAAAVSGTQVISPMPGTILKMNVKVGDTVKPNDLVCILEAMKMENEIFANEGGTVKAVNAPQGASVNSGDAIITLG